MGYRRKKTVLKLEFEAYDGLWVRVRAMNVEELMDMTNKALAVTGPDGKIMAAKVGTDELEMLFVQFAEALVEWSLEEELIIDSDEWTPVPPTREGVMRQEADFMMEIIDVWMTAVGGVEAPLPEGSNSGETSRELSLPMDVS